MTSTAELGAMLAGLTEDQRAAALADLTAAEIDAIAYHWPLFARPDQLPPGTPGASSDRNDWRTWLIMAGRGAGKSHACAQAVRMAVESGERRSIGLVGPTADTLRRDQAAAILSASPPWNTPELHPSVRQIVWPNGAVAYLLSSEEADRPRGLNLDFVWGDEIASWANGGDEIWSNVQMALRIPGPKGHQPQAILSTTPKRQALLKQIIADPSTVVTTARTWDNAANLAPETLAFLKQRYGGTSLGLQELEGLLLDEIDGALWSRALIESTRVPAAPETQVRCVVAVDPSGSTGRDAVGIVVGCTGPDGHAYIIADLSGQYSPEKWGRIAVEAYRDYRADRIVAESNYGGAMVESNIRTIDPRVPVRMVHASRGKAIRAAPIVSLWEQGRIHHCGVMAALEAEMTSWDPRGGGPSPDRLDAAVWCCTELVGMPQVKPARSVDLLWSFR